MSGSPFAPEVAADVIDDDRMAEKVNELLERNCVQLVVGWEDRAAVVNGGTSWYTVRAYDDRITCDCIVGGSHYCSHRLAAMVVWSERQSQGA